MLKLTRKQKQDAQGKLDFHSIDFKTALLRWNSKRQNLILKVTNNEKKVRSEKYVLLIPLVLLIALRYWKSTNRG